MVQPAGKSTAYVVIIGGGVIGTSIAYHLAARGMSDVIVVEKASLGEGSTSKAGGGIRQQFADELKIRLMVESMKFWLNFEELTGQYLDFRQVGYLFLLTTEDEVRDFTARVELQQKFGVPTRLLTPREAADIVPGMIMDGVLAATYCPTDGRVSPADVVYGYVQAARRIGAQFIEDVEVLDICTSRGKVTGVETSDGSISAPIVINATGPEARDVAGLVGVDLPVFPKRQHVLVTGPVAGLPPHLPCVVEPAVTLFIAPEGKGVLLTLDRERVSSKNMKIDRDSLPEVAFTAARRIPSVAEAGLQTAWVGLVELTPDKLPILGRVPEVEGFICANGLSGHGVMLSPAVGKAVAEIVLDGASSSVDVSELSIERFSEWAGRTVDLTRLALTPYL